MDARRGHLNSDNLVRELMSVLDHRLTAAVDPLVHRIETLEQQRVPAPAGDDTLSRCYASLVAIRRVMDRGAITPELGEQYNRVVQRMAPELNRDLDEFLLTPECIRVHPTRRGRPREVLASLFYARIDGLLNYLTLLMPEDLVRRLGPERG